MNRRKFISGITLSTVGWTVLPLGAKTEEVTDPWKARSIEKAIIALYGKDVKLIESDKVKVKVPKFIEQSFSSPAHITINSDIDAKRIVILQNLHDLALSGILEVPEDGFVEYVFSLKLFNHKTSTRKLQLITLNILIEDKNGNVYINKSFVEVTIAGGCA